jgi:hypothetical protein
MINAYDKIDSVMRLYYLFSSRAVRPNSGAAVLRVAGARLWGAILISLTITALAISTQATDFRGIVPAHSGKDLVRAKLGKPTFESEDRMEFTDKSGKAVIFFYTAGDTAQLNLSPQLAGKVLTIYFYPIKRAKYDLKSLAHKVVAVGHGWNDQGEIMSSYDDGERGISYHFLQKDDARIWRIVYYAPRAEFAKYKLADEPAADHLF